MASITSDDILGKEAVDPEGKVVGIVMKLHIEKEEKKLLGITIDQGFMKPDLFVGIQYVRHFGVDTVFLSRVPPENIKGLEVLTSDGRHVGRVKNIVRSGLRVDAVVVSHGFKEATVPSKEIKEIGARVILKKTARVLR